MRVRLMDDAAPDAGLEGRVDGAITGPETPVVPD